DPAEAAGDPDRSGAVRALMDRSEPGGRGGAGARARAARRHPGVPGVACDTRHRAVAEALPAELRRRRLAEQDAARPFQTTAHRRIDVGHAVLEDERPGHRPYAFRVVQILDGEWPPLHRTPHP